MYQNVKPLIRTLPGEIQFSLSQTPMPLAYVPMINTEFTDRMNLKQRTINLLNYIVQQTGTRFGLSFMDPLVHKYVTPNKGNHRFFEILRIYSGNLSYVNDVIVWPIKSRLVTSNQV